MQWLWQWIQQRWPSRTRRHILKQQLATLEAQQREEATLQDRLDGLTAESRQAWEHFADVIRRASSRP